MMRGLFFGAGQFAEVQLAAWERIPGVRVAGICNRTRGKAERLAERFGIGMVGTDAAEMLDGLKPDFVDICTAVESHAELVRLAADRKIPILCQKPIGPTLSESRKVVAYARKRETPLMINDNWRWQPWYREIKRLLGKALLGQVFSFQMTMRTGDGWGAEPYEQQPYFRRLGRFLIFETGVHYLDTMRFLFGEVETIYCLTRRRNPVIAGEDQCLMALGFEGGVTGMWDANRAAYATRFKPPFNGTMRIDGSDGYLEVDEDGRIFVTRRGHEREEQRFVIPEGFRGGSAEAAQRHFIETLLRGAEFETSGEAYLRTTELAFAAYESAERGKPVALASAG